MFKVTITSADTPTVIGWSEENVPNKEALGFSYDYSQESDPSIDIDSLQGSQDCNGRDIYFTEEQFILWEKYIWQLSQSNLLFEVTLYFQLGCFRF